MNSTELPVWLGLQILMLGCLENAQWDSKFVLHQNFDIIITLHI